MPDFFDSQRRNWAVVVRGRAYVEAKDKLNLVLSDCVPFEDDAQALKVLWIICRPQAEERNISQDDFLDGLYGKSLREATDVLVDEIVNFTSDDRSKALIKQRLALTEKLESFQSDETLLPRLADEMAAFQSKHGREMNERESQAVLAKMFSQTNIDSSSSSQPEQDNGQRTEPLPS